MRNIRTRLVEEKFEGLVNALLSIIWLSFINGENTIDSSVCLIFKLLNLLLFFMVRFFMCGLMRLLDMYQSLHATQQSGKSGGKTLKKWSCFSLWARIMFLFTLYVTCS